jgi:hypothetical protein
MPHHTRATRWLRPCIVRYSRVYLHTFGIFLVERRSQRKTLHINVVVMLLSAYRVLAFGSILCRYGEKFGAGPRRSFEVGAQYFGRPQNLSKALSRTTPPFSPVATRLGPLAANTSTAIFSEHCAHHPAVISQLGLRGTAICSPG